MSEARSAFCLDSVVHQLRELAQKDTVKFARLVICFGNCLPKKKCKDETARQKAIIRRIIENLSCFCRICRAHSRVSKMAVPAIVVFQPDCEYLDRQYGDVQLVL